MTKQRHFTRRLVVQLTLLTAAYVALAVPAYRWFVSRERAYQQQLVEQAPAAQETVSSAGEN